MAPSGFRTLKRFCISHETWVLHAPGETTDFLVSPGQVWTGLFCPRKSDEVKCSLVIKVSSELDLKVPTCSLPTLLRKGLVSAEYSRISPPGLREVRKRLFKTIRNQLNGMVCSENNPLTGASPNSELLSESPLSQTPHAVNEQTAKAVYRSRRKDLRSLASNQPGMWPVVQVCSRVGLPT